MLRSFAILLVAYFFHPVHSLAVELFLDGDMCYGGGRGGTVPMFFARCEPDDVTRPDFLDRASPALGPAATGDDNEGLA